MKKIYTFILVLSAAVVSAFGQAKFSSGITAVPVNAIAKTGISTFANDTLEPPSFGGTYMCDTAAVYYNWQAPATGYVFGNNSYGEIECAQKYYATGTVDEVLVWYGHVTGVSGTTSVKLYSINPATKGPSAAALGTSVTVLTGALSTTALSSYTFAVTVPVTSEFAAAVVFPTTAGDTVAVVSTMIGCATPDSLSWMNLPAYGGWLPTTAVIQGNVNCDLYVFPVGTLTNLTEVNEYSANGLSLLGAYPNPAQNFTNIHYRIDVASSVSVNVFDLSGRVVLNSTEQLSAGTHEIKVSLKNIPSGKYYYTIKTERSSLTSKFVVVK